MMTIYNDDDDDNDDNDDDNDGNDDNGNYYDAIHNNLIVIFSVMHSPRPFTFHY